VHNNGTVRPPWGSFTVLEEGTGYKMKRQGNKHRISNSYLGEDDIMRFQDIDGRL